MLGTRWLIMMLLPEGRCQAVGAKADVVMFSFNGRLAMFLHPIAFETIIFYLRVRNLSDEMRSHASFWCVCAREQRVELCNEACPRLLKATSG